MLSCTISDLAKEGVVVDVILEPHVGVHVFLIIQFLVHSFSVNFFDIESSPLAITVVSPLIGFAGFSDFYQMSQFVL